MAESKSQTAMRVDTKLVRDLAKMLDANGLTEIEVEDGDRKIRVARQGTPVASYAPAPMAAPAPAAPAPAAPAAAPADSGGSDIPADALKSPMVGTAYLSPEPGAAPFVKEGDSVKEGDTLMIIEAMKVMNPIKANKSGTIKQILIGDAQPVEFDQPIVVIA